MDINTKLIKLQEIIGTPTDIEVMSEDLNNKLHIIKTYSVICNLTNALKEVENNEYFPVLLVNTVTDENNEVEYFSLMILYRGKSNEIPSVAFQNDKKIEKDKILETINPKNTSGMLSKNMPTIDSDIASINLSYDIEENSKILLKAFLTEKQLQDIEVMILNNELDTKEESKKRFKL